MEPLIRWLYTGLYTLLSPLVLLALCARADARRRLPEYLAGAPRRAPGPLSERTGRPRVWLHAVSVGEALSALPVLAELRRAWPAMEVHLTSTIEDALVVALRSGAPFASARFLPLDLPPLMRALADRLQPDLVLVSETDYWPNMLFALAARGVPVFLVNGRVSYKIAGLFSRLGAFSRAMFSCFTHAFVQTPTDAARLAALGLAPAAVTVAGNTKYEASLRDLPPGDHDAQVAQVLADPRPRLVAGSTHPGEEALALTAARASAALLVLAPRDVRRAPEVAALARAAGLAPVLFSALTPGALAAAGAVVVDVLGVLPRLYERAAVAFIGGSFDGSGGHNFLEAARFAVPCVCGPKMRNFADDVAGFLAGDALVQAASESAAAQALAVLVTDRPRATQIGASGARLLRAHQGAAALTAEAIRARVTR